MHFEIFKKQIEVIFSKYSSIMSFIQKPSHVLLSELVVPFDMGDTKTQAIMF